MRARKLKELYGGSYRFWASDPNCTELGEVGEGKGWYKRLKGRYVKRKD